MPALEARPDVPLWLVPALDAWRDLGGNVEWMPIREWGDYYGIELEWLLPVLRRAASMLEDHQKQLRKAKRASTPRGSGNPRN